MNDFSSIIKKLMNLKGFKKPGQLWHWWGVNKSTFYTWKDRESIPFEQLISLAKEKKISLHWLFWNEGPPMRECLDDQHHLITDQQISEVVRILSKKGVE